MAKYLIRARIEIDGVVEKHDIIGAIFGQTEGLFGNEFDLRVLQDKGRIGRIQVNTKTQGSKTTGEILIPSNLDRVETALLAALIETVDKVGPYDASISIVDIVDLRMEKIKKIMERTVEILRRWGKEKTPDVKELIKSIQEYLKVPEPVSYGPEELPAGPDVDKAEEIIIVEGRADVINLLRYGYTNIIALGGARRVPDTIKKLAELKKTTLFVDGDHGGDLIMKEVLRNAKIDYIARAPPGREVEELSSREIEEALKKKIEIFQYLEEQVKQGNKEAQLLIQIQRRLHKLPEEVVKPPEKVTKEITETLSLPVKLIEDIKSLYGTLEAIFYSSQWDQVKRIPVRDLVSEIQASEPEKIHAIVFDGIITQRLIDAVVEKRVKILIGARLGKITFKTPELTILTFNELA
ncbi:DNA primase DnaG [Desulfurococcus amylolyticus]|uniref:DNA primase DnaG n=1 Tax=Desulfurococcus amylolyticus TaxID=94694 RepID=UPI0005B22E24|nr:DNA primase DnaG [Desulfurococcus amylolyticus]